MRILEFIDFIKMSIQIIINHCCFPIADSSKYLTKYSSFANCGADRCRADAIREHYHCYDIVCLGRVLSKKEEIIRHLKWHKKRNESLNHGFLRFSSSDDCSMQYDTAGISCNGASATTSVASLSHKCQHNRKQTHYHCLQPNCDKVYISTSDVQMHSNYHRKDSAIIQEGFQRYRATEECRVSYCNFSGQRTTHFHCRRPNCRYTFKNKSDMEKHKTYHIKDEQLARDGFKKFLKTEACLYERCRFSQICNHIHCVRDGCHYVLHSSGQLVSHKRKHDRMDSEQDYRRFKQLQRQGTMPLSEVVGTSITTPKQSDPGSSWSSTEPSDATATSFIQNLSTAYAVINNNNSNDGPAAGSGSGSQLETLNLHCKMGGTENAVDIKRPTMLDAEEISRLVGLPPPPQPPPPPHTQEVAAAATADAVNSAVMQITSIDGFFNRKRGRPPKNRLVEVYNDVSFPPIM